MEVLEEGRSEVRLEGTGVNGQLPDVTLYAYGQHANQTVAEASNLPEQREEEHEPLVEFKIPAKSREQPWRKKT